jgi:peptidoglycan hydrolase-like protein with peptidoglycan-binding domain
MTAAILTRLPLEAGGAVLASTGRMALSTLQWSFAHYMRAPLANTGIAAMVALSLMAGSNALYFQTHRHPAPLFAPVVAPGGKVKPEIQPVIPAVRTKKTAVVALPKLAETTGSVSAADKPIGNAEVYDLQRRLEAMKLFDGAADGYYGPQTARAIRAFEERSGLKPKGELTPEILKTIMAAPMLAAEPVVTPLPTPDPLPAAEPLPKVAAQPVARPVAQPVKEPVAELTPLRAPEPLLAPAPLATAVTAKVEMQPVADTQPLTRDLPDTPQEAVNIAVDTAGDAIDTILNGVQILAQTKPGKKAEPEALPFLGPQPTPKAIVTGEPVVVAAVEAQPTTAVAVGGDARIKPQEVAVLDTEARIEDLMPAFSVTDPVIVSKVQRGLSSLGFLHGPIDGVAGEATAKAIRTFETFYNYERTGRITPELPDLLVKAGATL